MLDSVHYVMLYVRQCIMCRSHALMMVSEICWAQRNVRPDRSHSAIAAKARPCIEMQVVRLRSPEHHQGTASSFAGNRALNERLCLSPFLRHPLPVGNGAADLRMLKTSEQRVCSNCCHFLFKANVLPDSTLSDKTANIFTD